MSAPASKWTVGALGIVLLLCFSALLASVWWQADTTAETRWYILVNLQLPLAITATVVGAALCVSGALDFVHCQLNPHYTDYQPPGHNGETRDDRLFEFTRLNPQTPVLAIREGTALQYTEGRLTLLGELEGFCFSGDDKTPIAPGQDLTNYIS